MVWGCGAVAARPKRYAFGLARQPARIPTYTEPIQEPNEPFRDRGRFLCIGHQHSRMYRASDRVDNEEWISRLETACVDLDLDDDVCSTATDVFLSGVPDTDRSKAATAAASLYAAALIRGQERPQSAVADAMDVSRLSVQSRWKPLLAEAGFSPPTW